MPRGVFACSPADEPHARVCAVRAGVRRVERRVEQGREACGERVVECASDIARLIRSPEGKTLEFKRDLSSHLPFVRTACAFANTAGGTVLIGIENRTGTVVGIEDPLDAEERLASIIADSI